MELFATTAVPEGDGTLTIHDKNQGVQNVRRYICALFGYQADRVRVLSPFVGGAFGAGLSPQYQVVLAVLAAHVLTRPVKVTLTRQQMFTFGHRPAIWQRVRLGAGRDGTLKALIHEAVGETSRVDDYTEMVTRWSGSLYRCENLRGDYRVLPLDLPTPLDMRAPGAASRPASTGCAACTSRRSASSRTPAIAAASPPIPSRAHPSQRRRIAGQPFPVDTSPPQGKAALE